MKRRELLRHLQAHGCRLEREGSKHSLWVNKETGAAETVPRHVEIGKYLSRKICRQLSVPEPPGG
jgi:mRNA interferase HicA